MVILGKKPCRVKNVRQKFGKKKGISFWLSSNYPKLVFGHLTYFFAFDIPLGTKATFN